MKKILVLLCVVYSTSANAALVTKEINYKDGAEALEGTLVYDDKIKTLSKGVVVYPEWWGHNDYVKLRAKELAKEGYVVFAADMYGAKKVTTDPKIANEWSKAFYNDRNLMQTRARAAINVLKQQKNIDKNKIAAIGFCFGGTVALELARSGEDLKAVGAFHAGLSFNSVPEKGKVKAKILVLNGAADPMVSFAERQKFIEEMQNIEADIQFVEFGNAQHAFTNPDADKFAIKGVSYNSKAEKRAFKMLHNFLAEVF